MSHKTSINKFKHLVLIAFTLCLTFTLTACFSLPDTQEKRKELNPITKTNFIMGTLVKITIYDNLVDENLFTQIFNRIQEIENMMTINKDSDQGEITKLNHLAGTDFVELSPETFYVLEKGKYYGEITEGKFDITIGPIVKLWNIGTEAASIPNREAINQNLPLVNFNQLKLNQKTKTAKLLDPGMMVDLGAIAKGYAADEAANILTDAGIKHAIINLGGNILTLGKKPDGSLFQLGIQDPYQSRNEIIAIVKLNNRSLVSSGTYEKFFEANSERYHHLIDPLTGYPAKNGLVGVSIITEKSIDADALSTGIFLLGLEKGLDLVERLSNVEAIFITNDKKVYLSSGINQYYFELINENYQLQE